MFDVGFSKLSSRICEIAKKVAQKKCLSIKKDFSKLSSRICEIAKKVAQKNASASKGFLASNNQGYVRLPKKKCLTIKENASHANFKVGRHEKGNTEKTPKT